MYGVLKYFNGTCNIFCNSEEPEFSQWTLNARTAFGLNFLDPWLIQFLTCHFLVEFNSIWGIFREKLTNEH